MTPSQPLRGHFTKPTNKNVTRLLSQWQCTISQQETVPDLRQPNDWRKRWDLVSRRNVSIEEAALVCGGRLFHAREQHYNSMPHPLLFVVPQYQSSTAQLGDAVRHHDVLGKRWSCAITNLKLVLSFLIYKKYIMCHRKFTQVYACQKLLKKILV